jgi:ABC-type uncharacterized transport system involved in gliding motility auxiliary subunit
MSTSWMKARQTKYWSYAVVYVLIVLAIVGGVNYLADRYNKSVDSTANKKFTLSDQTLKVVRNLKDTVTITYWDQTSRFAPARDLLDRYQTLSPKVEVQYMDTDKKRTQAIASGVKTQGTIFVKTAARQEEAKSLTEEEITGAIVRSLKGGPKSACFLLGSGEHSPDDAERDGYSAIKDALEKNNYKTQTVKMVPAAEIPAGCTIVIVGGPQHEYLQPEVDAVKTYVENGGSALIMLDPPLKFARMDIDDNQGFVNVLQSWGVTPDKDLVLDTSGMGRLYGLGPEFPLATSYESHPIVHDMKETPTAFPIARSLEVKNGDKTTVEKLFETSDNSFATVNLASAEIKPGKDDKKGPLTLGAAGTYNTGKENTTGRFVVVGSSRWVTNGFLRFDGNRDLFLNMINWLSADVDLISIRPKEPTDNRLNMTGRQMSVVFYESIVLIPLLIVIAGIGVWWRRR